MELKRSVTFLHDGPPPRRSLGSISGLQYGSLVNSLSSLAPITNETPAISRRRSFIAVAVLCYVNLLNYMERYTIAGVLLNIQTFFNINDSTAGLLQTIFICSFLLTAPLFGYLGDRYNRVYIMAAGLSVWLLTATGSSFVPKSYFWLLVLLRGLVGIGEASYSTIAPTIIGDLFTGGQRTIMIAAFYIFIPVGSGLGYITGSSIASLTGDWHWSLRITPILGVVGLILVLFLCPNPPRGAAENNQHGVNGRSSYLEDIKYLLKNKSYIWSSLGVTAMAFLTGALAFWMPSFLYRAQVSQGLQPPCTKGSCNSIDSYIFGAITVVSGILGVCIGTGLARWLRNKVPNADPLICAGGMLGSVPCLFITIFVATASIPATYVFIFIAEVLLSLNWSLLADMLLYIVVPTKRATAEALQITVCHLLGDAGSPYLIGAISDAIHSSKPSSTEWSFSSLQYSFLICPFVGILGGVFFLMTALYISDDRTAAQQLTIDPPQQCPTHEPTAEMTNVPNK
ncbi:protein spinster homolog 3 isoform X2 [Corythoichthys intestinalis]|uniref:protein spinster homolog 3 isoform X2 n=1 Tax=Corythoichthys intestinalis TaxID=161448 RepID=UPI0025A60DD5|nr:protein spinster homolog 3 isoform X2 [Corythoichthys intestinalis]XP_061801619.1 protein spinster homolog 3-like [Nerophis lumbriciformis]